MSKIGYNKKYYKNNRIKIREQQSNYYKEKRDGILASQKEYCKNNPEKIKKRSKNYYEKNREKIIQYNKEYRKNNPDQRKDYRKRNLDKFRERERKYRRLNPERTIAKNRRAFEKWLKNPKNRLSLNFANLIRYSLKDNKNGNKWEDIIDYTLEDLMIHLEKLFKPGMDWENYGDWHIDHRRPISSFSFNSYNDPEFKECWSLSNLQPLWAIENLSKGSRFNRV